ncbi:SDR family NAD(P)-dependent oxidoreductase [Paenibacillus sp. Leaf72]|uniref:SDR family NAD(P)-dependent oxidoreductase n=1 Tax=Paenibacillus sp. Leaf72 TaxID=1736234 RepID=UPI0006FFFA6E|nr:SDR family NAD(P)-dependent oxidoreductase [Paenibacillus sp. Leaf72]KQO17345.1 short-chain dehydrogenase [Paenibacillus sp. Leaf72]
MDTKSVAVITGATSGIGQIAAMDLAKRGMKLALTARSRERAEETARRINEVAPHSEMVFFYGDLSIMADVKRIGEEIKSTYPKIDVLVNNAGLHAFKQRITSEGFSEMMAVNYLAPWLLSKILLPSLKASNKARIVNVASEASRNHGVLTLPEDLTDTADFTARGSSAIYGKTKLLNIMFAGELSRQLSGTSVAVHTLNPGFNVTGLGRELWFAPLLERILKWLRIGDPRKGAEIITRLVVDTQYEDVTGGYYNVGTGKSILPVHPGGDPAMQSRLWKETQQLLKQKEWI